MKYICSNVTARVGGSVTLECGASLPSVFIWGFTKPGTDSNVAVVVYNDGGVPKLQPQSGSLGNVSVAVNTSALVMEELRKDAEGMYTCQALYRSQQGARVMFYYTRLDLEEDSLAHHHHHHHLCADILT